MNPRADSDTDNIRLTIHIRLTIQDIVSYDVIPDTENDCYIIMGGGSSIFKPNPLEINHERRKQTGRKLLGIADRRIKAFWDGCFLDWSCKVDKFT